ncbi:MAG: methyltransferase domain-containing protein [Actinomycetota bacterium]|nr:MAG: methyltransferase domain-containing protein [Actinomycetota bacterium]
MSPSQDGTPHLYLRGAIVRDIDRMEIQDSLVKIARLVKPGSRVLDVGCSIGTLGEYLTNEKGCQVDGVDSSAEALEIARPHYRNVRLADLEQDSLTDLYSTRSFDFIVLADVLEHLRDPINTLNQARELLDTGGKIVVSIPNITYVGISLEMLRGNFEYRAQGLLDSTHVRFFTERSMKQLVESLGMECALVDLVETPLQDSEFRVFDFKSLDSSQLKVYNSAVDAGVYQFIFEVGDPAGSVRREPEVHITPRKPALRFKPAVYVGSKDLVFTEDQTTGTEVAMDELFHEIHFELTNFETFSVRFDPSDVEGSVLLRSLTVNGEDGNAIWQWDPNDPLLLKAAVHDLEIKWPETPIEPTRLTCQTRDSWIVLPIPPEKTAEAQSINLILAWQASDKTTSDLGQDIQNLYSHLDHLQQDNSQLRREIEELRNSTSWRATQPIRYATKLGRAILSRFLVNRPRQ